LGISRSSSVEYDLIFRSAVGNLQYAAISWELRPSPSLFEAAHWDVTFPGKRTLVTTAARYASSQVFQATIGTGPRVGMAATPERLDELLPMLQVQVIREGMMTARNKPPIWFWIVAILLVLWEAMGCFACVSQIREGAAAMGPVDDWSLRYYAALPVWYNWVYGIATFGGLLGGLALLLRAKRAPLLFWISFVAVILMFGYAFVATDLVAHKGLGHVLPFPLVIAAIGAFSIWFARFALVKG
jgi:hypothetical protein